MGEGFSTDAFHLVKPEPHGEGAARSMKQAISRAVEQGRLSLEGGHQLHVNAHATSTPIGDMCEWNAITDVAESFEWISKVSVTANKSSIGHCFAAAGAIETIFTVKSINDVLYGFT